MRIGLIAPGRHPLVEPFAGGMEAHTVDLARELRELGHDVAVFGPAGSAPGLVDPDDEFPDLGLSDAARHDVSAAPEWFMAEHGAYLRLMLRLERDGPDRFDVVHDNAIHYLTLSLARLVPVPAVATLHTPPTPWAELAMRAGAPLATTFCAVSRSNARSWRRALGSVVEIPNGVDTRVFTAGAGGGRPVWTGRLVAEKGADHAIAAARRAGTGLVLAGPIADPGWFAGSIAPLLSGDIEYAGHLGRRDLAGLVGSASAAVAAPRWDEPFGLTVAEALACGTPVASYDRGASREILDAATGVLAPPDDVPALARALVAATALPRPAARRRAEEHWSLARMAASYASLYEAVAAGRPGGPGLVPAGRAAAG